MSRTVTVKKSELNSEDIMLRNSGKGKLVISTYKSKTIALLIKNGETEAIIPLENNSIGQMYVAKIKKIMPAMNACFVEISPGEECFLALNDIKCPVYINKKNDAVPKPGDDLVVRVETEAIKSKKPTVSSKFSVSNMYFAMEVEDGKIGFSKKLSDKNTDRIKSLLSANNLIKNGHYIVDSENNLYNYPINLIIRTKAGELSDDELLETLKTLQDEFFDVLNRSKHSLPFSRLTSQNEAYTSLLMESVNSNDYTEIVTDLTSMYEALKSNHFFAEKTNLYENTNLPLKTLYSFDTRMAKAMDKYVYLKSGGSIVIEHTEAMTVIDVNTSKSESKDNADEARYKINLEAAKEISNQLKLRNISGIIIVDFINMQKSEFNYELIESLKKYIEQDKIKTRVVDMTKLGLVEITRQKTSKPLREYF